MSIKEKVAYLQGLAEGMNIDDTEEGRVLSAIIDILEDISNDIDELNENALNIGEELDALSDDLADVEEFLDELDLDDDFDFDESDWDDFDDDVYDDEDESDDDFDNFGCCNICGGTGSAPVTATTADSKPVPTPAPVPEVTEAAEEDDEFALDVACPECGAGIALTADDIAYQQVTCPACGKDIDLEIDEIDVEDE